MKVLLGNKITAVTAGVTSLTGTLSFTNGSTAVTGSGTDFENEVPEGGYIQLDAHGTLVLVDTVGSATSITLAESYAGATASGAGSVKEEDPQNPDDAVLDESPSYPWTTLNNSARLTVDIASGSSILGIAGCDFDQVAVEVKNAAGTETFFASQVFRFGGVIDNYLKLTVYGVTEEWDIRWIDYGYTVGAHVATLDFSKAAAGGGNVGVVVAGPELLLPDPLYGLDQYPIDYSPKKRYENGAKYYRRTDIVYGYAGQIRVQRERSFYNLMNRVAMEYGEQALFWQIADGFGQDGLIYGSLNGMPKGKHGMPVHSMINYTIEGAI